MSEVTAIDATSELKDDKVLPPFPTGEVSAPVTPSSASITPSKPPRKRKPKTQEVLSPGLGGQILDGNLVDPSGNTSASLPTPTHPSSLNPDGTQTIIPAIVSTAPVPSPRPKQTGKCLDCGATESPEFRTGPQGPRTLCNACGVRLHKLRKKEGTAATRKTPSLPAEVPLSIPTPKRKGRDLQAEPARMVTGGPCTNCGATVTPEWRRGPQGPHTLCNGCGVRWGRSVKALQTANGQQSPGMLVAHQTLAQSLQHEQHHHHHVPPAPTLLHDDLDHSNAVSTDDSHVHHHHSAVESLPPPPEVPMEAPEHEHHQMTQHEVQQDHDDEHQQHQGIIESESTILSGSNEMDEPSEHDHDQQQQQQQQQEQQLVDDVEVHETDGMVE